jgi:hypothetical protein
MTTFYKFETQEQFQSIVGSPDPEATFNGIALSVIGLIPDGGSEPVLDDLDQPVTAVGGEMKPDGSEYEKGEPLMQPTFIEGWHVNAAAPVEGWEAMQVEVNSPMRVFG